MNDEEYFASVKKQVADNANNENLLESAKAWHDESRRNRYQYLFTFLGRPIIQDPQDIITMQEVLWECKPDIVIETGIARGGSLMLSASILALLDHLDGVKEQRKVIGIDIDIRTHNREKIETHPLNGYIEMIEGSSIDTKVIDQVKSLVDASKKVVVFLDSYHTRDHVYKELLAYAPLVSLGSYCVVFDTGIEDVPVNDIIDREWGPGNGPKTAVNDFLSLQTKEPTQFKFKVDDYYPNRNLITSARGGFLKRER